MAMFWVTAAGLVVASCAALFLGLWRGRAQDQMPETQVDLRIYRDQLAEVDRDAARGTLSVEEAARLRIEVSRRILEADKQAQGTAARAKGPGIALTGAVMLAMVAGSIWLYQARLGAPLYPDLPLAARIAVAEEARLNRPGQALAEAEAPLPVAPEEVDPEFLTLMERLRETTKARPDDLRGQELLAQNEARLGFYGAAQRAQAQIIRIKGDQATAEDYAVQAELMVFAAGGYVSPEAEAALQAALQRDPTNGSARFYSGLMLMQTGRPDLAFPIWRDLLEVSPPDAPWVAPIRQDIEQLAQFAGVRYALPPGQATTLPGSALPGPDAAAVAAASEMSEADRQAMIEGMVTQLNDRLARDGGSAEEWARLISALGVLGETDRARAIYAEAQARFEGRAEDLAQLESAAKQAGVVQ
ncbi:c-type cytochrome biogenesis protein CcmI [Gemmobacter serpentinus]|uniref:c-type cytochrome biogenesis protein CcmI n=1 Tax=Gemmobacter serpentinus TaxID=2652247 RepID=UPI00124E747A|nr:c-type cytochrome biogenesis protein CcmI [Gemmobacter serpentinus]